MTSRPAYQVSRVSDLVIQRDDIARKFVLVGQPDALRRFARGRAACESSLTSARFAILNRIAAAASGLCQLQPALVDAQEGPCS